LQPWVNALPHATKIAPMDLAESARYLQHYLALAGRNDPLIADDAVGRLHKASLGLPRALNNAAVAVLIAAPPLAGHWSTTAAP
jgi:type II secretory pathway predicted ATPase ExeA